MWGTPDPNRTYNHLICMSDRDVVNRELQKGNRGKKRMQKQFIPNTHINLGNN